MATGIVKMFNEREGFGFIRPADGGVDLCVRQASVLAGSAMPLWVGVRVEYTPSEGENGPVAAEVRAVAPAGLGARAAVDARWTWVTC